MFPPSWGRTPRRLRLGLYWLGRELGHLPSRSLPLFPSDTSCIVWGRSSLPYCSTRGTLAGVETLVCLEKGACTLSQHVAEGVSTTCLGMSTCIACTVPGLRGSTACLGVSTCPVYTTSLLGVLLLPGWE